MEYLVDWHPSWTPGSSLPAHLLDEWTANSNDDTIQHDTNTVQEVQTATNDEEDALTLELIECVLYKFRDYIYPSPSQGSAATSLSQQLFQDSAWTFLPTESNHRHLFRLQALHNEEDLTAAQTLRLVFLAALHQKHTHPSDRPPAHRYDNILVQYNGDLCSEVRSATRTPQPAAGVPIRSLVRPLFSTLWDLQPPAYDDDGKDLDRADLPRYLDALQPVVDSLVTACPYLLALPWPLTFISLFRTGEEVGERLDGVASPFIFTVDEAIDKRFLGKVLEVVGEQGGLEHDRWGREEVGGAFRKAQGVVLQMCWEPEAWREKLARGEGEGGGGVEGGSSRVGGKPKRKREGLNEGGGESGKGGKRRKAAPTSVGKKGVGKAAGFAA